MLREDIYLQDNFLEIEDCFEIINFIEKIKDNMFDGIPLIKYINIDTIKSMDSYIYDKIYDIQKEVHRIIEIFFDKKFNNSSFYLDLWSEGSTLANKLDVHEYENIGKHVVSLICLNDDFDGGELKFIDANKSIAPSPGSLVTFSGSVFENAYNVAKINKGERYTIGGFWKYHEDN